MTSKNASESKEDQVNKKPIPDGGYGWVVLVASFFVSFILDGIMYSFGLLIPSIKEFYKADNEQAGLITSLNTGFLFCSGPIVAGLCKTFGCRTVVMGGAIVTSILYFGCCFMPSIFGIMALYGVLGGVSTGCTYIASLIVIAEYFDKKIGIATGITMAGSGMGSFIIPPIFEMLIEHFDWKFTMSVCAGGILLCCICGALLKPLNPTTSSPKQVEMKNFNKSLPNDDDELPSKENFKHIQTFMGSQLSINTKPLPFYQRNKFLKLTIEILKEMTNFKLLCQNTGFLLITLSNFIIFTGYFVPFLYLVRIANENNIANFSWLISIIGITNIPFRMGFGWIADTRIITPINLNTLCIAIATGPFFFYKGILENTFWSQATFAFIFAVGTAGVNSLTTAYLVDLVGIEKFSNATGIINLFRGFGCFLGPFIAGIIADTWHMRDAFYFSGICFVVGLVLALLVSFGEKCCHKHKDESLAEDNKLAHDSEMNAVLLNNKAAANA